MSRLRTYVAVAAVAASLVACSGDDDPSDDPTTGTSETASGDASPTESASPSVEPAAGKPLKGPSFTARAPEGWRVEQGGSSASLTTIYAGEEDDQANVTGFLRIADGPAFLDEPLPKLAKERAGSSEYQTKPEVLDNVEVDGVEMYHVAGEVENGNNIIDLGAIVGEQLVEIHIESDSRTPEELQEVLDSVLATWTWT